MKKTCFLAALLLCALPAASSGAAEVGGKAGIGLLGINKSDNLWGHGVSRIPNLTSPPTELSYGLLVPAVEVRYKSGPRSASEVYLGTVEEPGSITAGIRKKYDGKNIDLHAFYSYIGSAWEDPYVLVRTKTDLSEYGAKLSYTQNRLTLSYRAALTGVDNDAVGRRFASLERDGSLHTLKGSYGFALAKGWKLTPGLMYETGVFSGDANSYGGFGASVGLDYLTVDGLYFNASVQTLKGAFSDVHPIYGEERDERTTGGSILVSLIEPFGYEGFFISAVLSGSKTDSNIGFFEKKSSMAYLGTGYRF